MAEDRLRVKWLPAFKDREKTEPFVETIAIKYVLMVVQLHTGVLSHQAARKLDLAGWRLGEQDLAPLGLDPAAAEAEAEGPGEGAELEEKTR